MTFISWLEHVGGIIWGPYMLVFMTSLGLWLTVRTRGFQFRRMGTVLRRTVGGLFRRRGGEGGVSPFQAVSTALAGTLGTGNIAGVATAVVAGGPGAVFWMWASAFFSMLTKYAEVALAVRYRRRGGDGVYRGGPMYYMKDGLGAGWLGGIFAVLCVACSFGIGNATQINTMAAGLRQSFGVPPLITGAATAVLVFLVIVGGIRRVGSLTQVLVPVMALIYLAGGGMVLIKNAQAIPQALELIISCAFSPRAAVGGAAGYGVMRGVRYGLSRGMFSNEAGLGSAPIAHASADAEGPVEQGLWGIFEVFVDTVVICGFTALIILTAGDLRLSGLDGVALTAAAFTQSLGEPGGWVVSVTMLFFAFSSILGWAWYGQAALEWLTGGRKWCLTVYRLLYVGVTVAAAGMAIDLVWGVADILNGLMATANLLAVFSLSGEVVAMTREWEGAGIPSRVKENIRPPRPKRL